MGTGSATAPGNIFILTQNPVSGWQNPSVVCTSDNPEVVFTPTTNGIMITSQPFSVATCDFTNTKASLGVSNIIFVPGFEGSRLYEKKGTKLTQRWEAGLLSISDVRSLFLDVGGNSVKNIVTKDVIEEARYPIFNTTVYKYFSDWLRSQKSDQKIQDFFLFPHDWRMSIANLAQTGSKTDVGTLVLKDKIVELASTSKTGKVTLIGHSNGGLLIKKTLAILEDQGQENLVDNVLFVGTPQLGTPGTLAGMLHGDDTKFGYGLVLSATTAREWAQNMSGAYGLLPFEKLYTKLGSFVQFANPLGNNWDELYGTSLDASEQRGFLTGQDGRKQPVPKDLDLAMILRPGLYDEAKKLHDDLDNFAIPSNIQLYEIAGVGKPTISGIAYKNTILNTVTHRPLFSCDGDKTVVSASAVDYGTRAQYLDLSAYQKDTGSDSVHFNMMENPEVVGLISNIVEGTTMSTPHISSTKPSLDDCKFKLIGTHSPVDLDVYDLQGRHVGINSNSTDAFTLIDTEIPGSDFIQIGDEKYAIVPDMGTYTIKIDGTGNGLFTLDIASQINTEVTSYQAYADLPVTTNLIAQVSLDTATTSLAPLKIDEDGNGTFDQEVLPNTGASPLSYLMVLRATIIDMQLTPKLEKLLLMTIDRIALQLKKGKIDKATERMQKFMHRVDIGKKIAKEMSATEKQDLITKVNDFLSSL